MHLCCCRVLYSLQYRFTSVGTQKKKVREKRRTFLVFSALAGLVAAFDSSDDRVLRASASKAVDSRLIPIRVKSMTLKLIFTAFMLDAQH